MNAHQRRKESRRRHMVLPLGKQVRVEALIGRTVYAYGNVSGNIVIHGRYFDVIGSATVHRHIRNGGPIDLVLTSQDGQEQVISTSMRGLRLIHPEDRARRPWWAELSRKAMS
jgi:hypothetical protein